MKRKRERKREAEIERQADRQREVGKSDERRVKCIFSTWAT